MPVVAIGVDLVELDRIQGMLARHPDRFLERCFTPGERAYCAESERLRTERLAARFAAKEAAFKAIGTGWAEGVAWTDAEVVHDGAGRPTLRVAGRAAEIARGLGIDRWHLTISHSRGAAIAMVVAESAP